LTAAAQASRFVLDNSVLCGWFLANQASDYGDAVAQQLRHVDAHAPWLLQLACTNVLLTQHGTETNCGDAEKPKKRTLQRFPPPPRGGGATKAANKQKRFMDISLQTDLWGRNSLRHSASKHSAQLAA
jgi:hypothetical protein